MRQLGQAGEREEGGGGKGLDAIHVEWIQHAWG